jgi:hypothetical protein
MSAAMCIGGGILNGLVFLAGPALLGYADLREESPELALLVLACNYALPMAAWMRVRGMAWRPTLEMSGATMGLAIAMIALDWLDVVQQSSVRGWVLGFCGRRAWSWSFSCCSGWGSTPAGLATRWEDARGTPSAWPEIHRRPGKQCQGEPDRVLGQPRWKCVVPGGTEGI